MKQKEQIITFLGACYGTKGQGFESLASHQIKSAKYVADFIFYNILIIL